MSTLLSSIWLLALSHAVHTHASLRSMPTEMTVSLPAALAIRAPAITDPPMKRQAIDTNDPAFCGLYGGQSDFGYMCGPNSQSKFFASWFGCAGFETAALNSVSCTAGDIGDGRPDGVVYTDTDPSLLHCQSFCGPTIYLSAPGLTPAGPYTHVACHDSDQGRLYVQHDATQGPQTQTVYSVQSSLVTLEQAFSIVVSVSSVVQTIVQPPAPGPSTTAEPVTVTASSDFSAVTQIVGPANTPAATQTVLVQQQSSSGGSGAGSASAGAPPQDSMGSRRDLRYVNIGLCLLAATLDGLTPRKQIEKNIAAS